MTRKKVVVICGSVRPGSMTKIAMRHVVANLEVQGCDVEIIDPCGFKVDSLGAPFAPELTATLQEMVRSAQGVVMCTPEYNGCFSHVLLAVIENLGYPSVLSGKPIGMLGVASGAIGAVKALEHLRGVCSHLGAYVLPRSISIAEVHKHFSNEGLDLELRLAQQIRNVSDDVLSFIDHWQVNSIVT